MQIDPRRLELDVIIFCPPTHAGICYFGASILILRRTGNQTAKPNGNGMVLYFSK
jgi:hypothetical protein